MPLIRIIFTIIGRALVFACGGLFAGAVIGMMGGGFFGVALGTLMLVFLIIGNTSLPGQADSVAHAAQTLILSALFGSYFGVITGSASAAPSFAILGTLQHANANLRYIFEKGARGAFRGAFAGAAAGATTGMVLHTVWMLSGKASPGAAAAPGGVAALEKALEPFEGGFFFGSIAGFALGLFAGALAGGLSKKSNWLTVPLRDWHLKHFGLEYSHRE